MRYFLPLLIFITACGGGDDQTSVYSAMTPKGAVVTSASPIDADLLTEVDRQLDDLFRIAAANGYSTFTIHPTYRIRIEPRDFRCDEISFMITQNVTPGTNYDGSEYDHDPRPGIVAMCVAGRFAESDGLIRVTAEGIRTAPVVRYEGEHKLLYQVDRPLYESTKIHGQGQGHPILGDQSKQLSPISAGS